MPILSKQQLEALNQVSFPDNNTNYITPEILRNYNTDVIDTLVDSNDTGSFAQLNSTNTFTQTNNFAAISASSFVSASSFIGDGSRLTNITSSIALPILDEGVPVGNAVSMNFSGSAISAQVVSGIAIVSVNALSSASFNAYTQSTNQRLNSLETNSASVNVSISNLNQTTASLNTSVTNLNSFTASQTGLNGTFATTGSNTFKGDQRIDGDLYISGTNFIDIGDGSFRIVDAGNDITLLDSQQGVQLRNFTANDIQIEQFANGAISIDNNSGSVNISAHNPGQGIYLSASVISLNNINFNSYSSSVGTTIAGLNTSASLALYTASFDNGTRNLTFTKGDTTQFSVNIPDVSGSTNYTTTASFNEYTQSNDAKVNSLIDATGSYATTGSNTFVGEQIISASLIVTDIIKGTGSITLQPDVNDARTLGIYNTAATDTHITASGGNLFLGNDETYVLVTTYANQKEVSIRGDKGITASGSLDISGSLTASLEEGYVWVGDSNNRTVLVATSSFGSGGTIDTGSFATTGSNQFNGDQTITGSLNVKTITTLDPAGTTPSDPNASTGTLLVFPYGEYAPGNPNMDTIANSNGAGYVMSGPGITDGTVTSAQYGNDGVEVNITSGNVVSGSSYIGTGPYYPTLIISGSAFSNQSFSSQQAFIVQNQDATGVAYGGMGIQVDTTTDPTNIFSTVFAAGQTSEAGIQFGLSSYTPMYGGQPVPTIYAGGYYDAGLGYGSTDTTITFYSSSIQNWKRTQFKASIQVTGSVNISNQLITNTLTASLQNGYMWVGDTNGKNRQILTSSFATNINTGSLMRTGSVSGNVLTFTKGDATTFSLTVATGSSINTGSFVTTASFNAYTASQSTGSLMRTGSVSGNVLTFTKGDATTFSLTVATGSGGTIDTGSFVTTSSFNAYTASQSTGSFATTGSNQFNGNQTITGSLTISGSIISVDNNGNNSNVIIGYTALGTGPQGYLPKASGNTLSIAIGNGAMRFASGSQQNIAIGNSALGLTTGVKNLAIGDSAMENNTYGNENMALGLNALNANTTGNTNIAIGPQALFKNTTAVQNTAVGVNALRNNTTGGNNFALGANSMYENTTGYQNIAIAVGALYNNTTGFLNTAIGNDVGFVNVSGSRNTYLGANAGSNHYGDSTIIIGGYTGGGQILNNNIILSDGQGSIKAQYDASAWLMKAPVNFTTGSNAQAGTATLDGGNPGTVTVSNSLVTANSIIMLTKQTLANPNGYVAVSAKSGGSFTITSNHNGDTDTVGWFIINNS